MYRYKHDKEALVAELKEGLLSQVELGKKYGISRQRVKQIANEYGINAFAIKQTKKAIEINTQYTAKWGLERLTGVALYDAQRAKFRAKKANSDKWEFTIQFGEISWPTHCPILGLELDYFADKRQENSPSIDRIDSTKGYVSGNVAIVSWRANRIKNDGTAEEHRKIADWLDATQSIKEM